MAPLAMSYVPMQVSSAPSYEASEALARGTLFPGLDLPFMNIVNEKAPDVPTAELMAIDFVTDELELYLDTHAGDREAFDLYQNFLALRKEARARGFDIAMFGHTHRPYLEMEEDLTLLNPGSLSYPRQDGRKPSYMIMEIDSAGKAHFTLNYFEN